jgi:hypothetical protein
VCVSAATDAAPKPDRSVQVSSDAKCDSSETAATKAMAALKDVATLKIITNSGVPANQSIDHTRGGITLCPQYVRGAKPLQHGEGGAHCLLSV